MIKVTPGEDRFGKDWKLEIDEKIIEKVKISSLLGDSLDFFVWLNETPKVFFAQRIEDFFPLQSGKIQEVKITISAENPFENEIKELLPDEFLPLELKKELSEEDESSFFLTVGFDGKLKGFAKTNFLEFFVAAQFWKYPFSVYDFFSKVKTYLTHKIVDEKKDLVMGQFTFVLSEELTIKEAFDNVILDLRNAFQMAISDLKKQTENQSLTTRFFSFPDEVRVPCEQYLLYFTEFLRDLGINTKADIKHEAGEILFSVTPDNPNQALDKIRVALEVFLDLPKREIIIVPDEEFEIAMLKAKANIDHLNSQLSLAKAEVRVKEREIQAFEATLEAKDISIEFLRKKLNQQKRLLNGEIAEGIIDIEPKPKNEDREEFFDGVLALTQYEEKGVRVNLAQLYRKLKTYLKGE